MPNSPGPFKRWVARVVGVPLSTWLHGGGKELRNAVDEVQDFTVKHDITLDHAASGICTKFDGWAKTESSSNQRNFAEAAERANQAEAINIANERLLKNEENFERIDAAKVRQEEANAEAQELANEQKRVEIIRAKAELLLFLKERNMAFIRTLDDSVDVFKVPNGIDYPALDQSQTTNSVASQDDSSDEEELRS